MTETPQVASDHDVGPDQAAGYGDWWSTELRPWWRDFDSLGHLTAASYVVAYQEAFADFMEQAWADPDPSYVVARMSIGYHHEVRRDDGPIRVYVGTRRAGRASFDATMVLCSSSGRVCSTAETRFAAWDREHRRSRPLTTAERSALLARGVGVGQAGRVRSAPGGAVDEESDGTRSFR